MTTLTEFCGLSPDALQKYLKDPSSITMSQPDNHSFLQIAALTDANDILRDQIFKTQSELARQDRAYVNLAKDLRAKALSPDTTAVRAALYAEVAEQIEKLVNGEDGV